MTSSEWHLLEALLNWTHCQLLWLICFPDFPRDDNSTVEFKTKQRNQWKYGSFANDGKPSFLLIIANLWTPKFNTLIVCWKKQIKNYTWSGLPNMTEQIVCRKTNMLLWVPVPNCLAYLTCNLKFKAHLANGNFVVEHSMAFDCIVEIIFLMTSSFWHHFERNIFIWPNPMNENVFLTSQAMIILHLNLKPNKEVSGNKDPLQMKWWENHISIDHC